MGSAAACPTRGSGRVRRPPPYRVGGMAATGNNPPVCASYRWRWCRRGLPPALAATQAAAYDGSHAGRGLAACLLAAVQSAYQRCGRLPDVGWPQARDGQLVQVAFTKTKIT
ncbi:hypothetical protein BHE74_00017517 [Ensete ventricosum]|nr:hypothetical protein BHE74_00017517 [Ensete ventricosum]